jgi:hypothetical protein
MCGGKFEIDAAVVVGDPLDVAYLGPPDPVREEAQIHMMVNFISKDLVGACV